MRLISLLKTSAHQQGGRNVLLPLYCKYEFLANTMAALSSEQLKEVVSCRHTHEITVGVVHNHFVLQQSLWS